MTYKDAFMSYLSGSKKQLHLSTFNLNKTYNTFSFNQSTSKVSENIT